MHDPMTQRELVAAVTDWLREGIDVRIPRHPELTQAQVGDVIRALLDVIEDATLTFRPVRLAGFGTFDVRGVEARTCRGFPDENGDYPGAHVIPADTPTASQEFADTVEEWVTDIVGEENVTRNPATRGG